MFCLFFFFFGWAGLRSFHLCEFCSWYQWPGLWINRQVKVQGTFWHHASHDSSSSLIQCFFLIFIDIFNWCVPLWRERTELKSSVILSKMTEQNRNKNLHSAFRNSYNFHIVDTLWFKIYLQNLYLFNPSSNPV